MTLPASAVILGGALLASPAAADRSIIKNPGQHPDYSFEAEPHGAVGFFNVGPGRDGIGVGFRGTIPIVDNGFIKTINNSVGIGFGIDWLHYDRNGCYRFRGDLYCDDDYEFDVIWLPVVMQWNFWLSENWSVFAEPGFAIRINDDRFFDDDFDVDPVILNLGGRFHFSDAASLTMRLGFPTFSIGVSFFL